MNAVQSLLIAIAIAVSGVRVVLFWMQRASRQLCGAEGWGADMVFALLPAWCTRFVWPVIVARWFMLLTVGYFISWWLAAALWAGSGLITAFAPVPFRTMLRVCEGRARQVSSAFESEAVGHMAERIREIRGAAVLDPRYYN